MKRRNPYSDLGLLLAASIFICILIKSMLFGITWGGIVWMLISCLYFYVSWKYSSEDKIVKHATTSFLVLSLITVVCVVMFDKKAMPKMHAFEGTGDTIQDVRFVDEGPVVVTYEESPADTTEVDSMTSETESFEGEEGLEFGGEDVNSRDSISDTTI